MSIQWPLVLFTVLAGMGAALYAAAIIGLLGRKSPAPRLSNNTATVVTVISIVLLVVGGTASAFHLSHVENMFKALNHPTSGIFMEALFLGILIVLMVVFIVVLKRQHDGAEDPSTAVKAVGGITALISLAYLFILGSSYMMPSRPAWNTFLLPLTFATTAAVAGFSLYLFLTGLLREDETIASNAGLMLVVVSALSVLATAAYAIGYGSLFGSSLGLYVILVILAGSIVPLVCGFMAKGRPGSATTLGLVALVCGLLGCFGSRSVMWLSGAAVKNMHAQPRY